MRNSGTSAVAMFTAVLLFGPLSPPSSAHDGGQVIGEDSWLEGQGGIPGQGYFRRWSLVDNNRRKIRVTGVIDLTRKRAGDYLGDPNWYGARSYYDGDWCIHVTPDSADCLRNAHGEVNSNGQIELEVHNPVELVDTEATIPFLFKRGDRIIADGYWVEDQGHAATVDNWMAGDFLLAHLGGKTELHPAHMIMSDPSKGAFSVFVGHDESGRFSVSNEDEDVTPAPIEVPPDAKSRTIAAQPSTLSSVAMLEETLEIDSASSTLGLNSASEDEWPAWLVQQWRDGMTEVKSHFDEYGRVQLNAKLKGSRSNMKAYYVGRFQRLSADLLTENVSLTTRPLPNGFKALDATVRLDLGAPASGPLAKSRWLSSLVTRSGASVESLATSTGPTHSASRTFTYSPSEGIHDARLEVSVQALTKDSDYIPGVRGSRTPYGPGQPEKRAYIRAIRSFELASSDLQLLRQEITVNAPVPPTVGGVSTAPWGNNIACIQGYALEASLTDLIGMPMRGTPNWTVQVHCDSEGNAVNEPLMGIRPPPGLVAPGLPAVPEGQEWHGVVFTISDDLKTVTVKFPRKWELFVGRPSYYNRARLTLGVSAGTDFGEVLDRSVDLSVAPAYPPAAEWATWQSRMRKWCLAMRMLVQMGLIRDPNVMSEVLGPRPRWPKPLLEKWPSHASVAIGVSGKIVNHLPKENQVLMYAVERYVKGLRPAEGDEALLKRVGSMADSLPDVKWTPDVPRYIQDENGVPKGPEAGPK